MLFPPMLFNFAVMAAIAYILLTGFVLFAQSHLIYFPDYARHIAMTPCDAGLAYESVEISTVDGETLHGWFVPASEPSGTVLFFHGNAGNISHRMQYLSMFNSLGYNTFIFDYRGYGDSSGTPSEPGTYRDAEAAWDYLTQERSTSRPHHIVRRIPWRRDRGVARREGRTRPAGTRFRIYLRA
jgi:pimeloyl-ACP methyl ester carboxylesterase